MTALVVSRGLGADIDTEKKKLQGTWTSVSFEGTGLLKNSKTVTLVFDGDKVLATIGDEITKYEVALDIDMNPKHIDLIPMSGKTRYFDQLDQGIYSVEGDVITLCMGGQRRPSRFELRPNTVDSLIKLKRK
jgi:uncharacterized protein (TIGR03067 family)